MKLVAAACFAAASVPFAQASTANLRVSRDSTVSFNGIMCNNNTVPCSSIPLGLQTKLTTFKGNRDYERVLLGFDLPTNHPSRCILRIPRPIDAASTEYALTATITDNIWDEATVSGYNKQNAGKQIASLNVTAAKPLPGALDITAACLAAQNGKLSLFVDTSFPLVSFNSIQSGSPDIFYLDYSF
ncbi:hypothetical protein GQ54DRAFT_298560 [Martensiomyces pterosporus]|nr:hypothetical protein GQ54DRAFT_298560 [Martensiomyces pterosporus]